MQYNKILKKNLHTRAALKAYEVTMGPDYAARIKLDHVLHGIFKQYTTSNRSQTKYLVAHIVHSFIQRKSCWYIAYDLRDICFFNQARLHKLLKDVLKYMAPTIGIPKSRYLAIIFGLIQKASDTEYMSTENTYVTIERLCEAYTKYIQQYGEYPRRNSKFSLPTWNAGKRSEFMPGSKLIPNKLVKKMQYNKILKRNLHSDLYGREHIKSIVDILNKNPNRPRTFALATLYSILVNTIIIKINVLYKSQISYDGWKIQHCTYLKIKKPQEGDYLQFLILTYIGYNFDKADKTPDLIDEIYTDVFNNIGCTVGLRPLKVKDTYQRAYRRVEPVMYMILTYPYS